MYHTISKTNIHLRIGLNFPTHIQTGSVLYYLNNFYNEIFLLSTYGLRTVMIAAMRGYSSLHFNNPPLSCFNVSHTNNSPAWHGCNWCHPYSAHLRMIWSKFSVAICSVPPRLTQPTPMNVWWRLSTSSYSVAVLAGASQSFHCICLAPLFIKRWFQLIKTVTCYMMWHHEMLCFLVAMLKLHSTL